MNKVASIFVLITFQLCTCFSVFSATNNPLATTAVIPNVLHLGLHVSDIGKLDPHRAAGSQDRVFADMVFNGLLRYKPGEAPVMEPDLAKSIPEFTMRDGRQVWTVRLRKGVMFHPAPGLLPYELTADDVIFSLKKSADKNGSSYAGEYSGMSFSEIDDFTVEVVVEKPLSPVLFLPKLTNYAGGFIVSKKAIEKLGYETFTKHPVGTGPFSFSRHVPGKKVVLAANASYFRGRPALEKVEIHFVPEIEKRQAMFIDGQLDVIIGHGERGWLQSMEGYQDFTANTFGVGEVATLYFNTTQKPLNDVKVRRALAYALDRKGFLATTNATLAGPVFSPVPEQFLPGGLSQEEVTQLGLDYAKNLEKAKKLLAQAGYPEGFSLDLLSSEKRFYRSLYEVLQTQLEEIGVICKVRQVNHSTMHKEIRRDPTLPLVLYTAWRPNADAYLTRFFHSDSTVVTGKKPDTNFAHYDEVNKLIEAARWQVFPDRQISLWSQAQVKILSDMVAYPLIYVRQLYLRKNYVDYGHPLQATMALYPQITEKTVCLRPLR